MFVKIYTRHFVTTHDIRSIFTYQTVGVMYDPKSLDYSTCIKDNLHGFRDPNTYICSIHNFIDP